MIHLTHMLAAPRTLTVLFLGVRPAMRHRGLRAGTAGEEREDDGNGAEGSGVAHGGREVGSNGVVGKLFVGAGGATLPARVCPARVV